jgi:hypothetical protein
MRWCCVHPPNRLNPQEAGSAAMAMCELLNEPLAPCRLHEADAA